MGMRKMAGAVLVGGLLVAGVPGTAEAAAKPKVLKVTPALRTKLKAVYRKKTKSRPYKKLRIESTHHGRVGKRYWALTCLYYADSPVQSTDCGTTFTKRTKKSAWKVQSMDGGFQCTSVPLSLIRAWKLTAGRC